MRIKLLLTPNQGVVPFNYQYKLIGVFHRWMGRNKLHDKTSLYSLGWLQNGKLIPEQGFNFPNGSSWEVSIYDHVEALKFLVHANQDIRFAFGMYVNQIRLYPTPSFGSHYKFWYNSPILVRKQIERGVNKHLSYKDPEADEFLTRTFRHKMKLAGLAESHLQSWMGFDRSYTKAKEKLVTIRSIQLKANACPVIVMGTPEAVQFAWEVGAGHLTGSCFGQLKS